MRDHSSTTDVLTAALALTKQGLSCFPCAESKRPTTPQGFKNATRDQDILRDLWSRYPGHLIGVPTGNASQLDVLDIDGRHGGARWFAAHRVQLPETRVHRTRSGGLHLLFQHADGLHCSAGRIAEGVDVRASGGYVIWWPAAGLDVLSDAAFAPWPRWLLTKLLPRPNAVVPRMVVPDDAALARLVRLIVGAKPGERNSLTFWAACRAGEMVCSGMLAAATAAAIIAEAATRAGLPAREAERTAWSGIRASGGTANG